MSGVHQRFGRRSPPLGTFAHDHQPVHRDVGGWANRAHGRDQCWRSSKTRQRSLPHRLTGRWPPAPIMFLVSAGGSALKPTVGRWSTNPTSGHIRNRRRGYLRLAIPMLSPGGLPLQDHKITGQKQERWPGYLLSCKGRKGRSGQQGR